MTPARWMALLGAVGALLGGCGGGSSGPLAPVVNASPGGLWTGTDTQSGLQVIGLVTEEGQYHFIRGDYSQYVGTATVSGTAVSGSFEGYAPVGYTFQDGSTHGTGSVSGTVHERSSFTATTVFQTDRGASANDTLTLTFDTRYNQPSSLAAIAGNWTDVRTGAVYSVSGSGVLFAQDANTGCVINGQVSIIHAAYNAYAVSATYAGCGGLDAVLNGATLNGIGAILTGGPAVQVIIGLSGAVGGTKVALVEVLNQG